MKKRTYPFTPYGPRAICHSVFHEGQRWIPVQNFPVLEWSYDQQWGLWLSSACEACHEKRKIANRKHSNDYHRRLRDAAKAQRDIDDPRLPVEPFQAWLHEKLTRYSISAIAREVGVNHRRVSALRDGQYTANGKLYYIKHLRYSTIESYMMPYGDHPTMIYSEDFIEQYIAA